ncbi:hypothetical protein SAMN05444507_112182 [Pseudomonas syringae]|uniref:ApeA N-terminal domain 1-containing protein n=1 Tax=Pseudomonas syringae TaxID=317 RepID=UPI0008F035AF|nr:HEPN domain-containing protein [Pseudomonas syringae]SFI91439.1 hypothetical protein SAMN05444507_112182 [Pseudomonas syringae]
MSQAKKILCCFNLNNNQHLSELLLDGENTTLTLNSRHPIPHNTEPHSLFGESLDYRKISLFECIGESPDSIGTFPKAAFQQDLFPHYAIVGDKHVSENEKAFDSISFGTDDLGLLFSPAGMYGSAQADPLELQALLDKSFPANKIATGGRPTIFYFAGPQKEVAEDVTLGLFSTELEFQASTSDHAGINCTSNTLATLKFKEPKTLLEAIDSIIAIQMFLTIISGRYQGIQNITGTTIDLALKESDAPSLKTEIYWSYAPIATKHTTMTTKGFPITPKHDSGEFYDIFRRWMHRHESWMPARLRIINWQKKGRNYDENRLVAAANAFDILPNSTYPEIGELSAETLEAKNQCKALIRKLKAGPEKEQALNTLTFWGGKSLKLKVLSRAKIIHEVFGDHFADLDSILTIAIATRNYYVHGTNKFGHEHFEDLIVFLTDALEFVFMASDLIECGWDAKRWAAKYVGASHPLAAFYRGYLYQVPHFLNAKANAKK